MHIQAILHHGIVHVFNPHIQIVWAADTGPDGVSKVSQSGVRAIPGRTEHGQVYDPFGHISITCNLCSDAWADKDKNKYQGRATPVQEVCVSWVKELQKWKYP